VRWNQNAHRRYAALQIDPSSQQHLTARFDPIWRRSAAIEWLSSSSRGAYGNLSANLGRQAHRSDGFLTRTPISAPRLFWTWGVVGKAEHAHALHACAIVEAFPSSFLGVLISNPLALQVHRRTRSDTFYVHLAQSNALLRLLRYLLPGRTPERSFESVVDHDERASVVCALTALCVAAGDYSVVGNGDGWIVLPPPALIQNWAWKILLENARGGGLGWSGSSPIVTD